MTNGAHADQLPLAILFDIDETLISTGGAGTKAWMHAFDRLHGIPANIGRFTEPGMTDPEVGRRTFVATLGREPTDREMARLLGAYLERLETEVEESTGYRVMPGVTVLLPRLVDAGILLGLVSGSLEAAAHMKLARAGLNRFFSFGGYGSDSSDRTKLTAMARPLRPNPWSPRGSRHRTHRRRYSARCGRGAWRERYGGRRGHRQVHARRSAGGRC